jgi:hypothetical protein
VLFYQILMITFLAFLLLQVVGQVIKLFLSKTAITLDPGGGITHRPGLESQTMHSSVTLPPDQAGLLQDAQVFGNCRERDTERLGQFRHAALCPSKQMEDMAPSRVGQSGENRVECRSLPMLNHVV